MRWRISFRIRPAAMPVAIVLLFLVPSVAWVSIDRSIWSWDPASYGMESVDLWARLRSDRHTWHYEMVHALRIRPPAIAWAGQFFVPLHHLFGAVEPGLLLSTVLWQTATLLLVYLTGMRLTGGRLLPVLFGVLLVAGAPLFMRMAHAYFVEPIQTCAIVWVLFIMVSAPRWHPSLTLAQLAAAASLGLLAKISTPSYMAVPALIAVGGSVAAWRDRPQVAWWRTRSFVTTAPFAALLALGTIEWYRINWSQARANTTFSLQSILYGRERSFGSNLWFRLRHLDHALFLPYFDLALGAVLVVGVVVVVARGGVAAIPRPVVSYRSLCVLGCLSAALAPILGLALQVNEADRFLHPIVPALGLALVGILGEARVRTATLAASAVVAAQFIAVSAQSFSAAVPRSADYSPDPPERNIAFVRELDHIIRFTCTNAATNLPSLVGPNYPWLSGPALQFRAWAMFNLTGPQCTYVPVAGYAERDPDLVWRVLTSSYYDRPFFVTVDFARLQSLPAAFRARARETMTSPDVWNATTVAIYRRVLASPDWVVLPAYRRNGLIVLRRIDRR